MKPLRFVGSSLDDLRSFPAEARRQAGFELYAIQRDLDPSDWKPMKMVGSGVREIRIRVLGGCAFFMWLNLLMRFTYCTLFKRKRRKLVEMTWKLHNDAISNLENEQWMSQFLNQAAIYLQI